jgi:DNA polymerase-3 subunit beta
VSVDRLALLASLRAVSTMTANRTNGVKFETTSESLSLRSEDPETGEMDDSIPCECRGTLPIWGLNAAYLIDVLNAYVGPKVELWLTGELDPLAVCDSSLGDRAVAVIMPMRLW